MVTRLKGPASRFSAMSMVSPYHNRCHCMDFSQGTILVSGPYLRPEPTSRNGVFLCVAVMSDVEPTKIPSHDLALLGIAVL
eukprot:15334140-Ditylum_brightwellii.AAC.1